MPGFVSSDTPLAEGVALFNQGRYYDCHDVLEALWMEADSVDRPFYQGILQIAVGFYHLGNRNWRGATILLGEGVNRLRPFAPTYRGVAVAGLVDCGWAWLMALQQVGADQVADLAPALPSPPELTSADMTPPSTEIVLTVDGKLITLPLPWIYRTTTTHPDD
ncbi:MAG: DUF309 domain-containing protein [Leptolyngbyaceae cyanobacterium SM2_5_2]|nr:DUF309 domain-containing protein [Leptolyngbyaceae cyanobacterium SM2_5_2]